MIFDTQFQTCPLELVSMHAPMHDLCYLQRVHCICISLKLEKGFKFANLNKEILVSSN